ncbi:MAG: hypothetical protein J0L82_15065 [Deltaproteobacteria bacterium]|nr:hypothetical protein [Deltaproteobacteria bacterium]
MKATNRLKAWIANKWDTAETWLPGFLVAVSVLVVLIVAVVRFLDSGSPREPAAFVEISDSEIPADTVYADGRIDDVAKRRPRDIGSGKSGSSPTFIFAIKDSPSTSEISTRTGINGSRARAVVLAPDLLSRSPGKEIALPLELFEDTKPVIIFKVISGYEVNSGIHTGRAEDDPNSQVNLTTADGMVSGFIKYRGKSYRIISDPERGIHYIIEVQ